MAEVDRVPGGPGTGGAERARVTPSAIVVCLLMVLVTQGVPVLRQWLAPTSVSREVDSRKHAAKAGGGIVAGARRVTQAALLRGMQEIVARPEVAFTETQMEQEADLLERWVATASEEEASLRRVVGPRETLFTPRPGRVHGHAQDGSPGGGSPKGHRAPGETGRGACRGRLARPAAQGVIGPEIGALDRAQVMAKLPGHGLGSEPRPHPCPGPHPVARAGLCGALSRPPLLPGGQDARSPDPAPEGDRGGDGAPGGRGAVCDGCLRSRGGPTPGGTAGGPRASRLRVEYRVFAGAPRTRCDLREIQPNDQGCASSCARRTARCFSWYPPGHSPWGRLTGTPMPGRCMRCRWPPSSWRGTLVTCAQFRRFVAATGHRAAGNWESLARQWGEEAPVAEISWRDAQCLLRVGGLEASHRGRVGVRGAGTRGLRFPWGDQWDGDRLVWSGNSGGRARPVGSHPTGASPFGARDMAGNLWQWCSSKYRPYPTRPAMGGRTRREMTSACCAGAPTSMTAR